ncbi:hypothetical protein PMAYCL1PPCAC_22393, partial [Pristionchus mayeri]
SCIQSACIIGLHFTPTDCQICSHLMRNSTVGRFYVNILILDDNKAPSLLSMASHSKEFNISCRETRFSDPASFVTELASDHSTGLRYLTEQADFPYSFFGLPHS